MVRVPHNPARPYTLLTPTKRSLILSLRDDAGWSFSRIANHPRLNGADPSTIRRNYSLVSSHDGNCYVNKKKGRCGRKRLISTEVLEEAENALQEGHAADGEDLCWLLWPEVSSRTGRRSLCNVGLLGHTQRQKLPLNDSHLQKRERMWCKYRGWVSAAVFARGILINSDETKIMLGVSDGKTWCRRRRGQDAMNPNFVQAKERHGRFNIKINVWGAIHPGGVSELILVEGNLTAVQYVAILQRGLLPIIDHYDVCIQRPSFVIFQQDNDPKHTSRPAKQFLKDEGINVMEWAPKSPDMSPIENAWALLKKEIRKHPRYPTLRTAAELFSVAKEVWNSEAFKQQYAISCYDSFPRRLQALKDNNFHWIDY